MCNGPRIRRLVPAVAYLLLTVVTVQDVRAQGVTTGAVSGTVRDADGRPLAGARVSVLDGRTGTSAHAIADDAGRYLVPHLQPGGPYAVEARRLGYRPVVRRDVWVTLGQSAPLDFDLEPAPLELPALTVELEADPLFSRSRTGAETTLRESEIGSVPTIGRQITDYALLSPHVVTVRGGPSVGGQNFRFNNIRIDGAVNHDLFGLTDGGIPGGEGNAKAISVEAIEEIQILTAPFDVRHSGFTGGLINAVTRSGTNRWKGSAFGYHTNQAWVSELDGEPVTEFNDSQFGWTLGGPLLRHRLFLFTSGEFQIHDSPAAGPWFVAGGPLDAGARAAGIHPDSARRFIDLLEGLGFREVGTTGAISLENPRTNLFARLDAVPSDRTRLVLRHSYARTRADQPPFRGFPEFRLSSAGRRFTGHTNSTIAHLFARLGERWHNEAILNVQLVRLDRTALAAFPLVRVDVTSEIEGETPTRTLAAGADELAQAGNALDQDIIQIGNHMTGMFGRHRLTIGTHNELFRFRHRLFPQALGTFRFGSLGDLEANSPSLYTVNTITPGIADPASSWSLVSLGGYVQDAWSVDDRLTVNVGLRIDVPVFLDRPRANPAFEEAFGFTNARSPRARPRIQPRLGFNWSAAGTYRTQLRGGVGLFSGRPSFVWLSNAFDNTGTFAFLVCPGPVAPRLDAADYPESPPQRCTDGSPPSPDLATVDIMDPDFGFPLDLKLSFGVDRELPLGFTVTGEALYTRALVQAFLEELNLVQNPVAFDATQGGRPLFGTPSADGFDPVRKSEEFAHVVRLTNHSGGRALLFTFGLQRRMADWLRLRSSYTYADVKERQALFFPLAPWGLAANPIRGNPNDPERATSPFERRHQFVVSSTGRWRLGGGFELSLTPQYFATSGAPYSYTVEGDVNGDGYRSARIGRDNDLIYVPEDASEMAFRTAVDAAAFDAFVESEPCLRAQRGRLMEPYSCFAPWQQRWDLRGVIGLPGGLGRAELVFDVINLFANRLDEPVRIDRGISVLRLAGRVDGDPAQPLLFDFVGPTERAAVFERLRPQSQRWFQAGLRFRF